MREASRNNEIAQQYDIERLAESSHVEKIDVGDYVLYEKQKLTKSQNQYDHLYLVTKVYKDTNTVQVMTPDSKKKVCNLLHLRKVNPLCDFGGVSRGESYHEIQKMKKQARLAASLEGQRTVEATERVIEDSLLYNDSDLRGIPHSAALGNQSQDFGIAGDVTDIILLDAAAKNIPERNSPIRTRLKTGTINPVNYKSVMEVDPSTPRTDTPIPTANIGKSQPTKQPIKNLPPYPSIVHQSILIDTQTDSVPDMSVGEEIRQPHINNDPDDIRGASSSQPQNKSGEQNITSVNDVKGDPSKITPRASSSSGKGGLSTIVFDGEPEQRKLLSKLEEDKSFLGESFIPHPNAIRGEKTVFGSELVPKTLFFDASTPHKEVTSQKITIPPKGNINDENGDTPDLSYHEYDSDLSHGTESSSSSNNTHDTPSYQSPVFEKNKPVTFKPGIIVSTPNTGIKPTHKMPLPHFKLQSPAHGWSVLTPRAQPPLPQVPVNIPPAAPSTSGGTKKTPPEPTLTSASGANTPPPTPASSGEGTITTPSIEHVSSTEVNGNPQISNVPSTSIVTPTKTLKPPITKVPEFGNTKVSQPRVTVEKADGAIGRKVMRAAPRLNTEVPPDKLLVPDIHKGARPKTMVQRPKRNLSISSGPSDSPPDKITHTHCPKRNASDLSITSSPSPNSSVVQPMVKKYRAQQFERSPKIIPLFETQMAPSTKNTVTPNSPTNIADKPRLRPRNVAINYNENAKRNANISAINMEYCSQPSTNEKSTRKNSIFFYNSLPSDEGIQRSISVPFYSTDNNIPSLSFENEYLFSQLNW